LSGGEAAGELVGGTLTQLVASLGTPFAFNPPAGCVLFIDEVAERPYRVDRMLTQLRLSGLLTRVAAIVCNQMPRCEEPGGGVEVRDVVRSVLRDFPGPILFGLPSGHTDGPTLTLPFGVLVRVIGGGRPALVVEEAAVC
jgi:muramoyltetrapeptide carboxypeptidase